ncbi:unnamed protein product [Schistosoma mattheei]|uniref:Uncharacterized protein n=1 Tax=Schistosoma mattheei TaxID=31246 RepID=A0A183PSD7_9TREM|nr:unnamed protein product [Schistosoma mattheei]
MNNSASIGTTRCICKRIFSPMTNFITKLMRFFKQTQFTNSCTNMTRIQ